MTTHKCRACRRPSGHLVLDLGEQPACDYFPSKDAPGPDPVYPLQMWLCGSCGLAQLLNDPTVPEEPKGVKQAALGRQAVEAVRSAASAGLLPTGGPCRGVRQPARRLLAGAPGQPGACSGRRRRRGRCRSWTASA